MTMNKQSLIQCLEHIETLAQRGNDKAIILTVQKILHCEMQCAPNTGQDDEHTTDIAYHALNYRTAAPQHAEHMWQELNECIQRAYGCECPAIPDYKDYPAILREQAI
jgi:hypothetical protein